MRVFGYYFYYANNADPKGRRLPKKIAIGVYKSKEAFEEFLKRQFIKSKARKYIIKYGALFGALNCKVVGVIVEGAVLAETGSPSLAHTSERATEEGLKLLKQGITQLARVLSGPIRTWQQKSEANHYHEKLYMGKDAKGSHNPCCRSVESMNKAMREKSKEKWSLTEDEPRPLYVVVYNLDTKAGKDYEILFNKSLYPMGANPYNGDYFKGAGNARGGPFASWVIQTAYQETPVYTDGVPVKDTSGNLIIDSETGDYVTEKVPVIDYSTGEQKIDVRLVADLTMMHDRGGIDCSTNGKNLGNAPDQKTALPISNDPEVDEA